MIYLMQYDKWLTDGKKEERVTVFLRGKECCEGLAPSEELQEVWEHSRKTKEDWEIVRAEYLRELGSAKGRACLGMLAAAIAEEEEDEEGKDWNIVCSCGSRKQCAIEILYDELMKRKVECFVED